MRPSRALSGEAEVSEMDEMRSSASAEGSTASVYIITSDGERKFIERDEERVDDLETSTPAREGGTGENAERQARE